MTQNSLQIAQPRVRLEEPHDCTDSKDVLAVLSAMFDTLVRYDANLRYAPALATSWTISDDARHWTFHLRKEVQFHNGEPCDAEAVRYSLKRMAHPDMGAALGAPAVYHQYLQGMTIQIQDQHTISMTLAEPMADLLDVLVTGYILPPRHSEQYGSDVKNNPVGSGPYQFVDFDGATLRLKRNLSFQQYSPKYDQIAWHAIADSAERVQLVEQGQVDIATAISPNTAFVSERVQFCRSCDPTVYIFMFNSTNGPMQDARVRLSLNLGINRQAIIDEVLSGAGYPLTGFISPLHFGANPMSGPLRFDPERAKALLKEAGHAQGLSLTLNSPTALPNEAVHLSKAVAKQLGQIGIDLQIIYTENREAYAHQVRRKEIHDMCVFDSSPLSSYRVLKEKVDARFAGSWWQGYQNKAVEALLDQAQTTANDSEREALYRSCYDHLCQDPPWLYLYNHELITAVSSQLNDWQLPKHGFIDPIEL